MEERRRSVRTELSAELMVKRIDGQSGERVTISVSDLSTTGIGFTCDRELELNAVYDCNLTIWTKEVIRVFVRIVRVEKNADTIRYGGIFAGMLEHDACRIGVYQAFEEYRNKGEVS